MTTEPLPTAPYEPPASSEPEPAVPAHAESPAPDASETPSAREPRTPERAEVEEPTVVEVEAPESSAAEPAQETEGPASGFQGLGLTEPMLLALDHVGYEAPTPIQSRTIPALSEGRDVLGQAQTGTGKTGAFALPLLGRIDLDAPGPQILVLAPTRELAIQVAEAFQTYAHFLPGFHVLPIYGGQGYSTQLRGLRRGPHVVVGTPGRVMDHLKRGTLDLGNLRAAVIDEADEMLRMGFVEDVEWILEQAPAERQMALFSATMPAAVKKIVHEHLRNPVEVRVEIRQRTADTIRQRRWTVAGRHKLDALTRLLEVEEFDAMLVFVRTKTATTELAERLEARGFSAAPLNGDIHQTLRERTVQKLKDGGIDILVATDVAARGLDVERISHVINYDIPYDTEAYVHRIGRTGRAGRTGEAILFVAPRERKMLRAIERSIGARIEELRLPTTDEVNKSRIARFKARITAALGGPEGAFYTQIVEELAEEKGATPLELAAALARLAQGDQPFLLEDRDEPAPERERDDDRRGPREGRFGDRHGRGDSGRDRRGGGRGFERGGDRGRELERGHGERMRPPRRPVEAGFERYRIEVGRSNGVQPGHIVGAIANEAGLEGRDIGRIDIFDRFTLVDLPEGMPRDINEHLQRVRVRGQELRIRPWRE